MICLRPGWRCVTACHGLTPRFRIQQWEGIQALWFLPVTDRPVAIAATTWTCIYVRLVHGPASPTALREPLACEAAMRLTTPTKALAEAMPAVRQEPACLDLSQDHRLTAWTMGSVQRSSGTMACRLIRRLRFSIPL